MTSNDEEADLVVIGSGASGLAAALTAGAADCRALVLEKSPLIGGTSSWSGSLLWVPMNPKGAEVSFKDDRQAAIDYICRAMDGPADRTLVETYVDHAAETVLFLERESPLRLMNVPYPDSFVELPGGVARGRHLEPRPFPLSQLKGWRKLLREPPMVSPFTSKDVLEKHLLADFKGTILRSLPLILARRLGRRRVGGIALVATLMKGCLDRRVRFEVNHRVTDLLMDEHRAVIGVVADHDGTRRSIKARRGVVLAAGGFEWNTEMVRRYLPVPIELPPSPPDLSAGDNILLAERAGAQLARMDTYWHWPVCAVPGFSDAGKPVGMLSVAERTLPHCIWVNRYGRRFVNEAAHNCALAFEEKDAAQAWINLPAWSVLDGQYRAKYPILFKVMPGSRDPEWLIKEQTLDALAARLGIDADGLRTTVDRFNQMARSGVDREFNRGQHEYERALGDRLAPHPNLGTIEKPPFYALPVLSSAVGTRGGAVTNTHAQVLRPDGRPVPGFYAAGNAAACFYGRSMVAGGGTLLPGMTFARRGALHALGK